MLKLKKIKVRNTQDVDICVRDYLGNKYVLFPNEEKKLIVFEGEKKNGKCRPHCSS